MATCFSHGAVSSRLEKLQYPKPRFRTHPPSDRPTTISHLPPADRRWATFPPICSPTRFRTLRRRRWRTTARSACATLSIPACPRLVGLSQEAGGLWRQRAWGAGAGQVPLIDTASSTAACPRWSMVRCAPRRARSKAGAAPCGSAVHCLRARIRMHAMPGYACIPGCACIQDVRACHGN